MSFCRATRPAIIILSRLIIVQARLYVPAGWYGVATSATGDSGRVIGTISVEAGLRLLARRMPHVAAKTLRHRLA